MTTPNGSDVACSAAPSHDQANADWPWRALHGEKWSDDIAASNPASSARCTAASSAPGWICSWEAWKPKSAITGFYPVRIAGNALLAFPGEQIAQHREPRVHLGEARGQGREAEPDAVRLAEVRDHAVLPQPG